MENDNRKNSDVDVVIEEEEAETNSEGDIEDDNK